MASFWDNFVGSLVGKPTQPAQYQAFDPYAQDRQMRMDAYKGAMADYDKMMSTPGGAIPQGYRDMLTSEAERNVRAANPGAAQSGVLADKVVRAKNQVNMDLMNTELGQLNQQRNYMQAILGMNQPTQQQETMPSTTQQAGMLQKGVGDLAGRGFRQLGDVILGTKEEDDKSRQPQPYNFGYGTNNGGFGVQ
jgi:hypothetical protein